jgi:hypothetical protein
VLQVALAMSSNPHIVTCEMLAILQVPEESLIGTFFIEFQRPEEVFTHQVFH